MSYGMISRQSNEVSILVVGASGSGRTSFINKASQSKLRVSNGLASCTQKVEVATSFKLDGHTVTLIDVPGLDNTDKSDAEVWKIISAFLEVHYRNGVKLHGVLYFHRIADNRITGASKRSFDVFQKLCGETALRNVTIVTNMWDKVTANEGEAREWELKTDQRFFKYAIEKGAKITRHDNTVASAHGIIRNTLANDPISLTIQHELVDLVKPFHATETGQEICSMLEELIRKHVKEVESLQAEIAEAAQGKDTKGVRELKREQRRVNQVLRKVRKEAMNLASDYRKQRLRATNALKGRRESDYSDCSSTG